MYGKFAAPISACLVAVVVLHLTSDETQGQVRRGEAQSQLTAADVLPIIEAVTDQIVRSYEESTTRPAARVFIDGSAALRAFRSVARDMPETFDELGAPSYFRQAQPRRIICTRAADCPAEDETIYLAVRDVTLGGVKASPSLAGSEYLVFVRVQAGDSRKPGLTDEDEKTIGVIKSEGVWRATSSSIDPECICASLPCDC